MYIGLVFGNVPKIKIDRTSITFADISLEETGVAINFSLLIISHDDYYYLS